MSCHPSQRTEPKRTRSWEGSMCWLPTMYWAVRIHIYKRNGCLLKALCVQASPCVAGHLRQWGRPRKPSPNTVFIVPMCKRGSRWDTGKQSHSLGLFGVFFHYEVSHWETQNSGRTLFKCSPPSNTLNIFCFLPPRASGAPALFLQSPTEPAGLFPVDCISHRMGWSHP